MNTLKLPNSYKLPHRCAALSFWEQSSTSPALWSGYCFALIGMTWYDIDIDIDIFVNCNWIDSSTVQYSTHLHTNNTQKNTINNFGWRDFWDSNPEWSN